MAARMAVATPGANRSHSAGHTSAPGMQIPTGNLETLRAGIARITGDQDQPPEYAPVAPDNASLPLLKQAFGQLFDVMQHAEADHGTHCSSAEGITEFGEYAFRLHTELAALIEQAGIRQHKPLSAALVVEIAVWIACHDGRIDTLALLANTTQDTRELEALDAIMERIIGAVSPAVREYLEKTNPGRPWRILRLNRGTSSPHAVTIPPGCSRPSTP